MGRGEKIYDVDDLLWALKGIDGATPVFVILETGDIMPALLKSAADEVEGWDNDISALVIVPNMGELIT